MEKNPNIHISYTIRHPWKWVVRKALLQLPHLVDHTNVRIHEVTNPNDLPSFPTMTPRTTTITTTTTTTTTKKTRKKPKRPKHLPCTLRLEITSSASLPLDKNDVDISFQVIAHGTSNALRNLEDKDDLVRTLMKWKCEHICPMSILLPWDAATEHEDAEEEARWKSHCHKMIQTFPLLSTPPTSKDSHSPCVVLKTPMGSQGEGIYFLDSMDQIRHILIQNKQRAIAEKGFLESILDLKQRIPCWVLQAEVYPPLLIQQRHKFHLRSYIFIKEIDTDIRQHNNMTDTPCFQAFLYNQHEVRIASESVDAITNANHPPQDSHALYSSKSYSCRDRRAHITNGAGSDHTQRCLLHQVPELVQLGIQTKLEYFMADIFGNYLVSEMNHQIQTTPPSHDDNDKPLPIHSTSSSYCQFAIAGVDIMVNEQGDLFILEVNVNPAAPPEHVIEESFQIHLIQFMKQLLLMVLSDKHETMNREDNNVCQFIPIQHILDLRNNDH